MTADDVAATYNRLSDPDGGSIALSALGGVLGKDSAVAVDDRTVRFLEAPNGNFPYIAQARTPTARSSCRPTSRATSRRRSPGPGAWSWSGTTRRPARRWCATSSTGTRRPPRRSTRSSTSSSPTSSPRSSPSRASRSTSSRRCRPRTRGRSRTTRTTRSWIPRLRRPRACCTCGPTKGRGRTSGPGRRSR